MKSIFTALLFCAISILSYTNEVYFTSRACKGEDISIRFDSVSGFFPPLKFALLGNAFQSNPNFIVPSEGIYTFIIEDSLGQQIQKPIEVQFSPEIIIQTQIKNAKCNEEGEIAWQISGGTQPLKSTINTTEIPIDGMQNFAAGAYTIRVEDTKMCFKERRVRIEKHCLKPYTAFSPNGDNLNDSWEIININHYPNAWVEVFDRYGRTVFKSEGGYSPWDGKQNGINLPSGNYYYTILPEGKINTEGIINGSLVIMR